MTHTTNLHGADRKVTPQTASEPDFRYPQTVAKNAEDQLQKALKADDGVQAVDALIRYALAQSSISDDNAPDVIRKVEQTVQQEKRPDIRALLLLLEARIYRACQNQRRWQLRDRSNPEGDLPDDLAEWDNAQFDTRVNTLCEAALADVERFTQAIGDYAPVITPGENSREYVSTLMDFVLSQAIELTTRDSQDLYQRWADAHRGDTVPSIFIATSRAIGQEALLDVYRRYEAHPESGLALKNIAAEDRHYPLFRQYVQRFPDSRQAGDIRNLIAQIEARSVTLFYDEAYNTGDSIAVTASSRNVNEAEMVLYRVPDKVYDQQAGWELKREKLKEVSRTALHFDGTVPFDARDVRTVLPPLPVGRYVLAPRFVRDGHWQSDPISRGDVFTVTNLTLFSTSEAVPTGGAGGDQGIRIFVVDSRNGRPIEGATVRRDNKQAPWQGVTGSEGYVSVVADDNIVSGQYSATLADDHYAKSIYASRRTGTADAQTEASLFTDLAIYRPGETVRLTALCYQTDVTSRRLLPDVPCTLTLMDAARNQVDEVKLTTDPHGQLTHEFALPTDRMNGTWLIRLTSTAPYFVQTHTISVSEYKTPTFHLDLDDSRHSYQRGQDVTLRGQAQTYSGLPLAGQEVTVDVTRRRWTWWWQRDDETTTLTTRTVTTDGEGRFCLTLQAALFPDVPDEEHPWRSAFYRYQVQARATNAGGESQEARHSFTIGRLRGVSVSSRDYLNSGQLELPLTFQSSDEDEKHVTLTYRLLDAADTTRLVLQGEVPSDNTVIDTRRLPSGRYLLHASVKDDPTADSGEAYLILYKESDRTSPVQSSLWIPEASRRVEAGRAHIVIGTSTAESHIRYYAHSRDRKVAEGWLHYQPGLHTFTLPMPTGLDEVLTVRFVNVHDSKTQTASVSLLAPQQDQLTVQMEAFRDRLLPGSEERWTFRLTGVDSQPVAGQMMLELYSQALHDLADNTWSFAPQYRTFSPLGINTTHLGSHSTSTRWSGDYSTPFIYTLPQFYTYDREFFSYYAPRAFGMHGMLMKSAARVDMATAEAAVCNDACAEEEDAAEALDAGPQLDEEPASLSDIAVREGEVKVALWQPVLHAGGDGVIEVTFTAPESNATWRLQALAMNDRLKTAGLTRTLVTQRPVMVQPSLPRFVRGGDVATLQALVQNATGDVQHADVMIELFDPRTGDVLRREVSALDIDALGSVPVSITLPVDDTLPYLGFRIKAAAQGCGDGEQVMLPVLPSRSPVVEAAPFYLNPADTLLRVELPDALLRPGDDAAHTRLTLEVCANPVWYAVLALPTIADGNYATASALVHNLFALCVAQGVADANPRIREAIRHWTENNERDSVLVSQLQLNADLKTVSLLASPWLPEAERQTARMGRLADLTDADKGRAATAEILSRLSDLQNADGGFAWYKYEGCRSSYWVTEEVLEVAGELLRLGYVPADSRTPLLAMLTKAVQWYDAETVRQYEELRKHLKEKDVNYGAFATFAYIHTLYADPKLCGKALDIRDKCLRQLTRSWGDLHLISRAYTALTLHRTGHTATARQIAESLRQFAQTRPGRGMYWDGLQTEGYRWYARTTLSAMMLQTLAEVDPRTDELDQIRKWLLLEKQTTDWGNSSMAADAVRALLATGSPWSGDGTLDVRLDGRALAFGHADRYLGYARLDVTSHMQQPAATPPALTIGKTGDGPAWGALYAQYVAPMTAIQPARTDDLELEKQLYRYGKDGKTTPLKGPLHVGDKVQVRLVIRNGRTLEYVSLVDERGACFEPVDQTSHYRWQDATCYYHETRDAETRLYFDHLERGTHVYTYDVNVTAAGTFHVGVATAQCQYAAQQVAHTAGSQITVQP